MSLESFFDTASEQISSESEAGPGLPSYLVGANNHQVASGGPSLLDPSTWVESVENLGKFTMTATARAVTSIFNMVPETVNLLGGSMETADTYAVLSSFDNNLATYYANNQGTVDVVGDIAASMLPGMAGVKVLNWGQKALASASAGKSGFNMAAHIGLLPSKATQIGFEYGKKTAAATQTYKYLNAEVFKSIAAGYGQSALESAAFMGAAQATMHSSPLFENQDLSDFVWNSLGGGLVGGGIMGTLAVAKTYGAVKSGVKAFDKAVNPSVMTKSLAGLTPAEKILFTLDDIYHPPKVPVGETPEVVGKFTENLGKREMQLMNALESETNNLVKDPELASMFVNTLKGADYQTAVATVQHLGEIQRVGISAKTGLEKLAEKFKLGTASPDAKNPHLLVMYAKLQGEGAHVMSMDAPAVLNLADTVKHSSEIEKLVAKQKFRLDNTDWAPSLPDSHLDAEARYIWASKQSLDPSRVIGDRDTALLERAMAQGLPQVNLKSGKILYAEDYLTHLQQAKIKEAYLLQEAYPKMTTAEIAKRLNVKQSLLEGDIKTTNDLSDWIATDYTKGDWAKPTHIKLAYDVQNKVDTNGFVMDALTHAAANQKEFSQAAARAFASEFGEASMNLPQRIPAKAIYQASRHGAGAGFFNAQNENYGTLGSIMQQVGSVVNRLKGNLFAQVDDTFNSVNYKVLNNQDAKDDVIKAVQLIRGSPEAYVLDADGVIRMQKLSSAMKSGKGEFPNIIDQNSPMELKLKSQDAIDWLQTWIGHNNSQLRSARGRTGLQLGTESQDLSNRIYFPPPDPKNYNHFAFVVDSSVTGTGHVRMIHAADSQKLEELANKVRQQAGLKVITKSESEAFHKARQDYDFSLGINENYINTSLARKGISAPYFPETDANKILNEFMDWRKRADVTNMREWVKTKYAPEWEQITQLSKSYDEMATSTKSYAGKYGAEASKNPYRDLLNTALDVSNKEEYPVWTPLNRLMENSVSRVWAKLTEAAQKSDPLKNESELDRIQGVLKEAGISANYTDAATLALANHTAPKPVLEEFIRKGNSALSFFMLRSDPLNAVNNGLGHAVLYGSETRDLVKNIMKGNVEAAGELALLSRVKIPGSTENLNLGSILSPSKLASNAYGAYAKMLGGSPEMKELEAFFRSHGWMPSMLDQERSVMNALTLTGTEGAGELAKRLESVKSAVKTIASPVTKLNQGVEDMNRFVAAYTAKSISDLAVKHGLIGADDQLAYINTFVNRTQGNYIANQRPMLFQGPIGQAVGLFQTYQFNLMQQLFRYVGEGGNKSAAVLMGLQGTIYGMNGLPAFNAINTHLVGNAAGNASHKDIISQTYDTVGKEGADWLMYGAASNLFLHPDLKVNLYSRGDINPRQVTVIPTNPADVPIVGAVSKVFQSIFATAGKLDAGGAVYQTLLQGVEHAGISRPLAGLAQVAQAFGNEGLQSYSTTSKGSIIGANDLFSLTTFARMVGGRPLDEAIANDAVYRIRAYSAAKNAEINELGSALKSKIQAGTLTTEDTHGFMRDYMQRGGKQQEFNKFMMRQMKSANVGVANQLANDLKDPTAQNMQSVMGGWNLQDLANAQ